jgi:hypothetical protein
LGAHIYHASIHAYKRGRPSNRAEIRAGSVWKQSARTHKSYPLVRLTLLLVLIVSIADLPVKAHAGSSSDLTVESVWLEDVSQIGQPVSQLSSGQSFNIVATIRNVGQETASGYYIDVYYDGDYGRGGPDNIAAGEVQTWYVGPLTAQAGTHTTTWVIDPDNQIAEPDENNNQREYAFTVGSSSVFFLVVRDVDNGIWYGSEPKIRLPGSTPDSPGAVMCGGSLQITVRGSDNGIYYGYVTLSMNVFSGWTKMSGSTPSAPALAAASDCTLYLAVRGTNGGIYLNTHPSGGAWSGWKQLPGGTSDGPAVAVAGSMLHLAVRGNDGSSIWHGMMDRGTQAWQGWSAVPGAAYSKPALAAASDTIVYLAVRGSDDRIYVNTWQVPLNVGVWSGWSAVPTGTTSSGPSVLVASNYLYLAVRGMDNSICWCSQVLPSGGLPSGAWSSWTKMQAATFSSPTLA